MQCNAKGREKQPGGQRKKTAITLFLLYQCQSKASLNPSDDDHLIIRSPDHTLDPFAMVSVFFERIHVNVNQFDVHAQRLIFLGP